MPLYIPILLNTDPCCKFNDCLKILNQKYEEAKCDGCLEEDYAQEKKSLDRYIELEKMLNLSSSCGDDSLAVALSEEQEMICKGYTPTLRSYGCTDSTSPMFNPSATDPCVVDGVINGCCQNTTPPPVEQGCTNPQALNYDYLALEDDGSCLFFIEGCMDPTASNYDSDATQDNGSCFWMGCMHEEACNYNPLATIDDGSCCQPIDCLTGQTDEYFDCDACACVECALPGDDDWDPTGIHSCCPGDGITTGADYPCDPVII